ncbi:hypothetical protein [Vibrio marisflavi]|uniref:Uncharacterized protein n=1 Tax=Vibrio marisflavi CECT 7928 TaxID=634439 RepID=A0ABN8E0H3_9VIBR|nr:hypothetical protein [Vibrio marisflavi]CAH0536560.1 hypothetical protein VMF7928_00513 [Vibrio marisflavi CECT 7928]
MKLTFSDLDLPSLYSFIGWCKQQDNVEAVFFELKGWYLIAHTLPDSRLIQGKASQQKKTFFQSLKPSLDSPQVVMSHCVSISEKQVEDIVILLLKNLNEELYYNNLVVN